MQIAGRVAIVTAGAAGLGRYIVAALHRAGAMVVVGDVAERAEIEQPAATFVRCDVTADAELEHLISVADDLGPVGLMVNNAGGWSLTGRSWPTSAPEEWGKVLDLNLRAPMRATQLVLPGLRKAGGGAVIHVGSSGGLGPEAYGSPEYGAAKAGLLRFTSSLCGLAAEGIRVSCVVPHWIGLPRAQREYEALGPEERRRSGGLVDPDAIAAEVVRLAEDEGSAGALIALRADRPPYRLDPAGIDPYWS